MLLEMKEGSLLQLVLQKSDLQVLSLRESCACLIYVLKRMIKPK